MHCKITKARPYRDSFSAIGNLEGNTVRGGIFRTYEQKIRDLKIELVDMSMRLADSHRRSLRLQEMRTVGHVVWHLPHTRHGKIRYDLMKAPVVRGTTNKMRNGWWRSAWFSNNLDLVGNNLSDVVVQASGKCMHA